MPESITPLNQVVLDYMYDLPEELIARYPVEPPDHCRLMVVDVDSKNILNKKFYDLPEFLQPGDLLIVNNTVVEKRRVFLRRESTGREPGARIEAVFLERNPEEGSDAGYWTVLIKKRQRLRNGERLHCELDPEIFFIIHKDEHERVLLEESIPMTSAVFGRVGQMPIPPYLRREEEVVDIEAYQNPFRRDGSSVAAPTASLHFTPELVGKIKKKGIDIMSVRLEIGYGTFAPLKSENFETGKLHSESYCMPEETAVALREKKYKRVIAVGTTALRVVETVFLKTEGRYDSNLSGRTDLFLRAPHRIGSVDGLITNFHLPGSSLMMLVSCLTGRELLVFACKKAVEEKYRFFSYGDAMFIRR